LNFKSSFSSFFAALAAAAADDVASASTFVISAFAFELRVFAFLDVVDLVLGVGEEEVRDLTIDLAKDLAIFLEELIGISFHCLRKSKDSRYCSAGA
jgi:hypothetical protein